MISHFAPHEVDVVGWKMCFEKNHESRQYVLISNNNSPHLLSI